MNPAMTIPPESGAVFAKKATNEATNEAVAQPLARLRAGDLQSLTALIPFYQDRLYRYLIRMVREPGAAEDLFQETWLKAVHNIRRYDPARGFDHWLFSIAHNLAIDFLRRHKPDALLEDSPGAAARGAVSACALDRLLNSERSAAVASAIGELAAPYREVIALRFDEGMKLEQIAGITGMPLSTVKTRLRRALESLRKRFQ